MMVRYYGHHGLKQFIHGKPIWSGYNIRSFCGSSGCYFHFSLYCGKEREQLKEPLRTRALLYKILNIIEDPSSYNSYFVFFSIYNLFKTLNGQSYRSIVTLRRNRTLKCPIKCLMKLRRVVEIRTYNFQSETDHEIPKVGLTIT